ncbi:MarR family transcriptional regulator [Streptomyces sp. NBC_00457]|uniref:MarR family winged helix-turn-helix transcriptional regulator n=1 Tax=Streptomyces sp. NBC_00457 TaxID=2975748 RepID=UPI002E215870
MTTVRWLDDEEQEAWRAFVFATQMLHDVLDRQLAGEAGMPHSYYMILAMLSEAPRRSLSMGEVAELTRSSLSKVSHAMPKLEARGWVRRDRHWRDARVVVATLTDDGLAALKDAAPGHVEQVRRALFDRLDREQVRHLRDIFRTVLAGLGSDEGNAPAGLRARSARPPGARKAPTRQGMAGK